MNKLTDEEVFKMLRPNVEGVELDYNKMPIIKKCCLTQTNNITVTNFKNKKYVKNCSDTVIDMFNYDNVLKALWNNPLKYIPEFQRFKAVASPDFSIYPGMNKFQVEHNTFKNRWLGSLWQLLGINVIPTVSWCDESTYDICFSGIEPYGTVIISTLGCKNNYKLFIDGYNEMILRLKPKLIVVVGKIYEGMKGNFLLYELKDTFNPNIKSKQLSLFSNCNFLSINDGRIHYGW